MSSGVSNFRKTELYFLMLLDYKAIHNSGLSKTYTGLDLKVIVEILKCTQK